MVRQRILNTQKKETPNSIIVTETIEREYGPDDFEAMLRQAEHKMERIDSNIDKMTKQKAIVTEQIKEYNGYISKFKKGVE